MTPQRNCTMCGKPALFVAADATGLEWFECGYHNAYQNVAGVERVKLTPINVWFSNAQIAADLEVEPKIIAALTSNVMQAEVSGKCPFCGADIAFGSTPEPFATHDFPTCKKFDSLDVVDFLAAVNRKLLEPRPNPSS